ncbi:MAG: RagB/SusD family nutrient uptake outer membrane protein [Bacteroidales bacterium]|nr:RagB/SusD family nutrient uptake outer membrane protein [Bacteroidales bacterium]
MKKSIIASVVVVLTIILSCTDLDPVVYSEIVNDNFFKTEEQVLSAAGPAYQSLNAYVSPEGVWGLNELTSDEVLIPTRGIHWLNNQIYQRLHKHTWIPTDFIINNAWKATYAGVTNCNRVIYLYEEIEPQTEALVSVTNELKSLRGLYYFLLMDLFGGVPLVDSFNVPTGFAPVRNSRAEIFQFIENEVTQGVPTLNNTVNMTTYARFNRYAALTLLAKLYLNAEVYIGESMLDQAIAACDSVILSEKYSLNKDFFANFAIENENSPENIFVIPYSDIDAVHWGDATYPSRMFCHHLWTLHFTGTQTFNCEQGGWDGICALPSHYYSYDETDIRRAMWLTGQQFSYTGDSLFCNQEKKGQPLVYTPEVNSLEGAAENEGARFAKYDYTGARNYQLKNDYAFLRYADVLLMKAEALMRKNGSVATQEAVDLVNQIRARAFPNDDTKLYTTITLTMSELLAERGREFSTEGWRRNDLIRFGVYNDPVDFRPEAASATYNLFPIPQEQINANPNLSQNLGY